MAEPQHSGASGGATRKLKWLAGVVVALVAIYSAVWAYLAHRLDEGAETAIARAAAEGTVIACEGRDVRGYPFRLGLHCEATGVALADGTEVQAGAFRSAAQVYRPGLVISELDGPLAVDGPAGLVQATWDVARASTRFGTERLSDGRVNVSDVALTLQPDTGGDTVEATIAALRGFVRPNGENVDVALTVDDLDPAPIDGRDAPPIDLNVDATVTDAAAALAYRGQPPQSLRGRTVVLRAADVALVGGGRLGASGEVAVDAEGLATGTLDVAFTDLAATADALASLVPEYEEPIRTVAGLLGGGGGGGFLSGLLGGDQEAPTAAAAEEPEERSATITLDRGRARLGIIPLGSVPALP